MNERFNAYEKTLDDFSDEILVNEKLQEKSRFKKTRKRL